VYPPPPAAKHHILATAMETQRCD